MFTSKQDSLFADNYHLFSNKYTELFKVRQEICKMKNTEKIIIVGAGLSGLTLAYLLQKNNIEATILEASSRLGGRIQTIKGKLETPLELGATWFSDLHPELLSLVNELDLEKFPQFSKGISLFQTKSFEPPQEFFVPESESPSYRINGGSQKIIDALYHKLNVSDVQFNEKVIGINETADGIIVLTDKATEYQAKKVVLCLPPQLASTAIKFSPEMHETVQKILPAVQTWMSGAIKFVIEYASPFWRDKGYSGMLYSHSGIITEMYDHTDGDQKRFGFTGFLHGGAVSYTEEVRRELVLQQLSELLGDEIHNYVFYFDKIWNNNFIQTESQLIHRPHQNNGHALLQDSYMNQKLFFCGTETATAFGGYMEGAIIAAKAVLKKLLV